jgi:hypothetical protein
MPASAVKGKTEPIITFAVDSFDERATAP